MNLEDRVRDALRHRASAVTPRSRWHELEEAPVMPPRRAPSGRSRAVAAVVAFAVFVPAAVVGWIALRETEQRMPPLAPSDPAVAVVTLRESGPPDHLPSGELSWNGTAVEAVIGSHGWTDGDMSVVADASEPTFDVLLELPVGTELEIETDARSVDGNLASPEAPLERTGDLELDGMRAVLPAEAGTYVVVLRAHWAYEDTTVDVPFYFGVHLVENTPATPSEPTPSESIEVTSPVPGDRIASPVTISGTADVFEANVRIRIFDAINNMIVDTYTTASCGSGCRGDFSAEIEFAVAEEQQGEIVAFEESAETGKPVNVVRIPVTLVPGENLERAREFVGTWTDSADNPVPEDVLTASLGAEHCSWGDIVFLRVDDPPYATGGMTFVRDTTGELAAHTVDAPWTPLPALPDGLDDSGWRVGEWQLWFDPADVWSAYLHHPGTGETERWPTLRQEIGCD